jgi:fatty acid desaturase
MNSLSSLPTEAPAPSLVSRDSVVAGRFIHRRNLRRFAIPGRLNLLLVAAQMAAALAILALASRTHKPYLLIALAIVFAFVMQMGFCLAHEAVHRKLHPNRTINMGAGF